MQKMGELETNDFKNIDKLLKKESIIVFTGVVLVILVVIFMVYIILK
jgi:hypothetical protein